jgi:hypothetical protein
MSTIDRATVMGTFHDRAQAEQAVAELREKGFHHEDIGLVGQKEFVETMRMDTAPDEAQSPRDDLVSVTVKAQERWQEALSILRAHGAFDTFPEDETTSGEEAAAANADVSPDSKQTHLAFDPIAGPVVTTEDSGAVASGGYGLQRDPALDSGAPTTGPNVVLPTREDDTFFNRPQRSSGEPEQHTQ